MGDEQLQQGIEAAKAGDSALARQFLVQAVQQDPNNEAAWVWLAQVMETPAQKVDCLRQALRINPHNEQVSRAIQVLSPQVAYRPAPAIEEPRAPEPELGIEPGPEVASESEPAWGIEPIWSPDDEGESAFFEEEPAWAASTPDESEKATEETWSWDEISSTFEEGESDSDTQLPWEQEQLEEGTESWGVDSLWSEESEAEPSQESQAATEGETSWGLDAMWGEESASDDAAPAWGAPSESEEEVAPPEWGWGDTFEEPSPEPASSAAPDVAPSAGLGFGSAPVVAEPDSSAPASFMDQSLDELFGAEPEEQDELGLVAQPEAPQPATGRVSLLDRNRMDRIRASRPAPSSSEEGGPAPPFMPTDEGGGMAPSRPAGMSLSTSVSARKRGLRLLDWRVFFGIFGIVDIPIILVLLWLMFGRGAGGPAPSRSLVVACRSLDRETFVEPEDVDFASGVLDEDLVFAAGIEYTIHDTLVITPGRRVLIEPGARLIFDVGTALDVQGNLYVCGTAEEPVMFTAADKDPGGWEGVRMHQIEPNAVMLSYLEIHFAGERALYLEESAPTMSNVTIANAALFPISTDGSVFPDLSAGIIFRDVPFQAIEVRSGALPGGGVVWPNYGFVYVVSGLLKVGADTTLEIAPDVVIKSWPGENSRVSGLWVQGLLKANGVKFTSVYDDGEDVGGATYLESRDAKPGDWDGITFFRSSEECLLKDALVRYAGHNNQGAVNLRESSPQLENVAIIDAAWYPLSADTSSYPQLTSLTLTDNNPGNALEIRAGSVIESPLEQTWDILGEGPESQVLRVVQGSVTVEEGAMLTIGSGVIVKFAEEGQLVVDGTLSAVGGGTDVNRIVLTSLYDDDHGGDTDGESAAKTKGSLHWGGVILRTRDEESLMQNVVVRYASVQIDSGAPRLVNSHIRDSEQAGVIVHPNAQPDLLNNTLTGNFIDGVAIPSGEILVDQNWNLLGEEDDQLVRVLTGTVTVSTTGSLRIAAGVVIKADVEGRLGISGTLTTAGMAHMPVVFTSLQDDSYVGETGSKIGAPAPGDWLGLQFDAVSQSSFKYTSIFYAEVGLTLYGGVLPEIEDGRLQISQGNHALWCDGAAQISDLFWIEDNQVNERRCPAR